MDRRHVRTIGLLLAAAFAPSAGAQESKTADGTIVVTRGAFQIVHELKGAFDDPDAVEIAYRPEVYQGALEILEAVAPGAVEKDQVLVRFSTETIDEQIEDARFALDAARMKFERQEEEAKRKAEASAIELEGARMAFESAQQGFETYRDVLMPMRLKEAELSLQSSQDRMKEQEEQYEQLLKMYKADDLVEETEEIVLRREKRSLEQSKARMEFTLRRHQLTVEQDIPRELESKEFAARKASNDWQLARKTAELKLAQSHNELRQAKVALERQERSFHSLQQDREALVLRAPSNGIAVPGTLVQGKWTGIAEGLKTLRPGAKATANKALFTITHAGPRHIQTKVPESIVLDVREGQKAAIVPVALPNTRLDATVVRVAPVSGDGSFDTTLEVAPSDPRLLPGHACDITLTTLELLDVITVPRGAIAEDSGRHTVQVLEDARFVPRTVEVGPSSQVRTVVVSGLNTGDVVRETFAREAK